MVRPHRRRGGIIQGRARQGPQGIRARGPGRRSADRRHDGAVDWRRYECARVDRFAGQGRRLERRLPRQRGGDVGDHLTSGLYDLLDAGASEADVEAWLRGEATPIGPALSPADRRALADAWWFWARPGQRWEPGDEFITDIQCGRGFGKSICAREAICDAALDPERWGGYAIIVGTEPSQVERDCIHGPSGIFEGARRRARSGNGPDIVASNLNKHWLRFDAPRGGGDAGLTVYWASSYDPKSVHGPNVGLVWWDEFGLAYHDRRDPQGNTAWDALLPAVRAGHPSRIIITQTPSRAPQVRLMQADAERPQCPTCRARHREAGPYLGAPLAEPWRLPRSPQKRLHPLLNTRTTEVRRTCPVCGTEVVARVRAVYGDTRDNPAIDERSRRDADEALATGQPWAYMRFAPRGEVDSAVAGSLVPYESIERVPLEEAADLGRGPVADRWSVALARLGDVEDVVVVVDPAVTSSADSDETGVVAAGLRRRPRRKADGDRDPAPQVVGLQDWSVRPDEVEDGPPSLVWAPRAYWLAIAWGASRIVVETNQGGDEVLSAITDLVKRPPSEAEVMARLREEYGPALGSGQAVDARLGLLARRIAASARRVTVESCRRRADKRTRVEWYGRTAAAPMSQQAVLCGSWYGGAGAWSTTLAQITGYEPPKAGEAGRRRERKDRADALVAAAQVLLGVVETAKGEVEDGPGGTTGGGGWLGKMARASGPPKRMR